MEEDSGKVVHDYLRNEANRKAAEEIDKVFGDIMSQRDYLLIGNLREEILVYLLLPYLAGEKNEKDLEDAGLPLKHFYRISGSPTVPINIVNERKEVLFQLPPLIFNEHLDFTANQQGENRSLTNAFLQAKLIRDIRPGQAEDIIYSEVAKVVPQFNQEKFRKYIKDWVDIFDRYGYFDPIPEEVKDRLPEGTTISPLTPTDIEEKMIKSQDNYDLFDDIVDFD